MNLELIYNYDQPIFLHCSYINQRNRERNIKEAEKAFKVEVAEMKIAEADPFTRRQCRPTLVTKVSWA